jgi:hypothetical protein
LRIAAALWINRRTFHALQHHFQAGQVPGEPPNVAAMAARCISLLNVKIYSGRRPRSAALGNPFSHAPATTQFGAHIALSAATAIKNPNSRCQKRPGPRSYDVRIN